MSIKCPACQTTMNLALILEGPWAGCYRASCETCGSEQIMSSQTTDYVTIDPPKEVNPFDPPGVP